MRGGTATRVGVYLLVLLLATSCVTTPGVDRPAARASEGRTYLFTDRSQAAGIPAEETPTWGANWLDYDSDSDPDLVVVRHRDPALLLRNEDGIFTNVPVEGFDRRFDRHTCAWGEANHDGRPDLYCGQGAHKGKGRGPKQLFVQRRSHRLVDRARRFGLLDPYSRARSANWLDYDGDGDLDLFTGSTVRRGYPNALFRRRKHRFRKTRVGVEDRLRTHSSSWADWDVDGDPDLLVLQDFKRGGPYDTRAYRNDRGRFHRVSLPRLKDKSWLAADWQDYDGNGRPDLLLVSDRRLLVLRNGRRRFRPVYSRALRHGRAGVWFDVDNDGDLDAYIVQGTRSKDPGNNDPNRPDFLLINERRGFRASFDSSWRGARGGSGDDVAVSDYDRDGRLDLFVLNGYGRWSGKNTLLRNETTAGNWIALDLRGPARNPFGLGARIHVRRDAGRDYWRELNDGVSSHSQSEIGYVHLGIGPSTKARVRVVWPNGRRDCLGLQGGRVRRLRIGSHPC